MSEFVINVVTGIVGTLLTAYIALLVSKLNKLAESITSLIDRIAVHQTFIDKQDEKNLSVVERFIKFEEAIKEHKVNVEKKVEEVEMIALQQSTKFNELENSVKTHLAIHKLREE